MSKSEKIENWDEFDQMVDSYVTLRDMSALTGYISILEMRELIDENTSMEQIQAFLHEEFNVKYSLDAIQEHFIDEAVNNLAIERIEGQPFTHDLHS